MKFILNIYKYQLMGYNIIINLEGGQTAIIDINMNFNHKIKGGMSIDTRKTFFPREFYT